MINYVLSCLLLTSLVQCQSHCANKKVGYYPRCECESDSYRYDGRDCLKICPPTSEGVYPNCTCRYGDNYDKATNACPNPHCPENTITDSVFPDCKCLGKNFQYNNYLNGCYLVCPEDATGYFPNCTCEDKQKGFNKELFECMQCPKESTPDSIYPHCKTKVIVNATFDAVFNEFRVCENGAHGKFPNCTCENGNEYKPEDLFHGGFFGWRKAGCLNCPWGLAGKYPKCDCPDGETFDGERCRTCVWNAHGVYPDCKCSEGAVLDEYMGECRRCPEQSTGTYPDCICKYPLHYRKDWNRCLDCPEDAPGIYPNCTCPGEKAGFDTKWSRCQDCPHDSKGRHPNCECETEGHTYDTSLRYCETKCDDGVNFHPFCTCDNFYKEFLVDKTGVCRKYNYAGRPCPPNAIGISPSCHCLQDDHFFIPYGWGCFKEYEVGSCTLSCTSSKCNRFQTSSNVDPKSFYRTFV